MSLRAVIWAYEAVETADISPTAASVLVALSFFHNQETGRCDPSLSRICKRTKFSERAVRNALRDLEEAKLIGTVHRTLRTGRGKRNLTSRYILASGARRAGGVGHQMPTKGQYTPSAYTDLAMMIDETGEA